MIQIWNREKSELETEKVYGESAIAWLYGTKLGQKSADHFLSGKLASRIYGAYQSSTLSAGKIKPFIERFQIPMSEYEDRSFTTFNDFFARKFRPGQRVFEKSTKRMPAFCEARYFGYERVTPAMRIPVKGEYLSSEGLLGNSELAKTFHDGPLLLARLCPTDYHRFHFPDECRIIDQYVLSGNLHSVNPAALRYRGDIFITNERQVSILQTSQFGKLAYIEVGALCVGKIVQSYEISREHHQRGEEKGYFLFGASTVIVIGEAGLWKPDADLLAQTQKGIETYVKLGSPIATCIS
jgi:phosphatidylserine decarboxylase